MSYLKELFEEIYSCRSRHNCLKEWVDCRVPEPFIGNLHAKIAIIGANPGQYGGEQRSFADVADYMNYYEKEFFKGASDEEWSKKWPKGYLEAYKMLLNCPDAHLTDFNRDAIILNIVKCSTSKEWHKLPKWAKEEAKNNCLSYLIRQLEAIKPKVILAHGKFSCCVIIDMLKNGAKYTVFSASCDIETLAKKIHACPHYIDEISKEYVVAKNGDGRKTLFLFNWHLSRFGIAVSRLKKNIEKKRRMVSQVLSMSE